MVCGPSHRSSCRPLGDSFTPTSGIRIAATLAIAICCFAEAAADSPARPWQRSNEFNEQSFTAHVDPDVRFHVNAPLDEEGNPARGTRLIVFALPNGNTLEQTLGCKLTEGLDWHYDIQHVAAQVRAYRELVPDEKVVLICAEAKGRSWPNWRRTHDNANAKIAAMVDAWRREFGTPDAKVILTGHSGGGAFKYGVIEGQDDVPNYIDRIAFLDSDYWFEGKDHADKYYRWLTRDPTHRLVVICYDDRNITLNGKKVVSDTGGTFRGAGRMRDALETLFPITESQKPPFREYTGLNGRFQMFVHPNPDNKILHTVLVGEMNGLLEALTLGTPNEEKWGTFGGPRAYTRWVQELPTTDPDAQPPKQEVEQTQPPEAASTAR